MINKKLWVLNNTSQAKELLTAQLGGKLGWDAKLSHAYLSNVNAVQSWEFEREFCCAALNMQIDYA